MSDPALKFRQSRAKSYVICARRAVLDSEWSGGLVGASAELGSAFHAVAAEILRTLRKQGEPQMSTQECVEIMREVYTAGPWVLGPGDGSASSTGYDMLVQMTLTFAHVKWDVPLRAQIEKRLSHEILCPDGVLRLATGTPDLVIAQPPNALILGDHKTGIARPPSPDVIPEDEPIRGLKYMSGEADFQLVYYGLLALKEWPSAQTITLREWNWRWGGPAREATMTRADLEHAEPYLGDLLAKMDRGLTEGEGSDYARPRAGAHCATRCPVSRSCQIPAERRGLGALDSPEAASAEGERWFLFGTLRKQFGATLKAYVEATGEPIKVNGGYLQWWDKPSGGREFTIKERTATAP
jgi:hypothetical protein